MNKFHEWINTALILAVAILVLVGGNSQSVPLGNKTASFWDAVGGFRVNGTEVISSSRALSNITTGSFAGLITANAGTLRSYTIASSSVGTGTLQVSDVADYDTISLLPTGAAATKTLTFFASSTATTWLPTAGDMQETCFRNATGTAASTVTFAAGTGIDLEIASSTDTLVLGAGNTACFKFIRQIATDSTFDISALMIEYGNAD